jgi:hypothetical protein
MKFVAALIAAVATATRAEIIDLEELNDMYNAVEFKQSFSTLMEGFNPMLSVASVDEYNMDDSPCPCSQCVDGIIKHIMMEAWNHFEKECESSKCPIIKAHCAWGKAHPKVTQGAIFEELRPGSLGYSYCYGKGKCKHPGMGSNMTEVLNVFDNNCPVTQLDPLMELQAISMMLDEKEEFKQLIDIGPMGAQPLDEKMEALVTPITDGPPSPGCVKCIHGVTCHIMKGVADGIKEMCAKTKCPVMQRKCKWAQQHPEFTEGILLVKVRPDKYAYGACIATKKCEHGNEDTSIDLESA